MSKPFKLKTLLQSFEHISAAVIVVEAQSSQVLSLNHEASHLLGIKAEQSIGDPFNKLFQTKNPASLDQVLNEGEESIPIECELTCRYSGKDLVLSLGYKKVPTAECDVIVMTIQDVTQQRLMFERASKLSALGEMASGIAHEINNPLLIISGRCELLSLKQKNATIGSADYEKAFKLVNKMTQRIEKIIHGLQAFARDEANDPTELKSIKTIVEDTFDLCQRRISNKGVKINMTKVDPTLKVLCHPTQISQVLLNLINNAFDAVIHVKDSWIEIEATEFNDQVKISVSDSGTGVSEEADHQLFNPFFTTKPVGKGTGLGLSISRTIAESHGGELYYQFKGGHTCFVLTLPLIRESQRSA
jgi:PAS domain S-box-containing protein